jgi:hypothetical protein
MTEKRYIMSVPALVFFILVIILGITDLGFVVFGGTGASLSSWVVAHSISEKAVPYFPPMSFFIFTLGAICAHFWWGMHAEK